MGLELKRGSMLAALVRPLEGGLRFHGGKMPPPLKETLFLIFPILKPRSLAVVPNRLRK